MSINQSRAEKSEGQLRRSGRSGSSGQHRGSVSSSSSNPPALSTSRSFKKSGNGPGGQSRATPTGASPAVLNGTHVPASSHGSSYLQAPSGAKPVDTSVQRNSRALSKAPSSDSSQSAAAGASDFAVPSTPPKGDASKEFTLQFGTISPGIMNGMQIPARTSSAPPNLDEQKRAQARHDSFRASHTMPMPSAPKQQQQQTRKDVDGLNQSNAGESHPPAQTKRDVHLPISSAPTTTLPTSSVLPIGGMPMHMSFQQPQVPMQFGGPSLQMQSQGVTANSLQMTMALPAGAGPQVPQQMFIPNIQSHPLQPQAMMHQGQGLGFAPQIGHQLAPPLSSLRFGIAPQFPQQQPKFGGPRKTTVKITHPETHEELRLDKRTDSHMDGGASGQRLLPSVTAQSQHIPTFNPSHQINYYPPLQPNSYNPSPIFFPTPNSHPLTSTQMTMGSQGPRYSYPVGQSGQAISFMNPSVHNPIPVTKPGPPPSLHVVSEAANLEALPVSAPSAPVQVTIKPAVSSSVERAGTPSITISMPSSKAEAPKLLKPQGDATASHQEDSEIGSESTVQQPKSVEPPCNTSLPVADRCSTATSSELSAQRMQPGTSSSAPVAPVGVSGSVGTRTEDNKREPVRRSDSLKEHQKKISKKDVRHSHQQNQADASYAAGFTKLSSKIIKDSSAPGIIAQKVSEGSEKIQSLSGSDSSTSSASLPAPTVEQCSSVEFRTSEAVEAKAVPAVSGPSGVTLEKEASPDFPLGGSDSLELPTDSDSFMERGPIEASTSLGSKVEQTISEIYDSDSCLSELIPVVAAQKQENLSEREHTKTEVSTDLSKDSCSARSHPVSTVTESSGVANPIVSVKQEDAGAKNSNKANVCESYDDEKEQPETNKEAIDCRLKVDGIADDQDVPSTTSSGFKDDGSVPSSPLASSNAAEDEPSSPAAITNKCEIMCSQDVGLNDHGISLTVSAPVPALVSSETKQKWEGEVTELPTGGAVSVMLSGPKDKPTLELVRARNNAAKKKKRKEILSKADAAGTSDLYNAYKGPEEKHETTNTSENVDNSLTVDAKPMLADDPDKVVVAGEEDGQSKAEIDDWENAADISTPKLRTSENGQQLHGNEATSKKRYSRDFLLTFTEQCTDLPVGFEIGADIADALMSVPVGTSHIFDREPYPSPGRITDRSPGASRVDHRMAGLADDDKWTRAAGSFGPGRDIQLDMGHGAANVSFRPGQGVNYGVLRNPRAQSSNHFAGGILSGPVQSPSSQGGIPRSNAEADRWQRATGIQRGLIPSPYAPSQVMHKAANKYEVGKVSDKEVAKQRQLKAILNKLTPQNFEKLFFQVKEVDIDNIVTLTGVISQIFDKALMEPTFCEMYANFCVQLAIALPDFSEDNEKITFKRLLLNKCQEEFERGEREQAEANRVEEEGEIKQTEEEREQKRIQARRRMLGNIRLIGELYKKKMLTERIMHECIKKLLGDYQNPDEEDVEALCKLMSTIGEMIDHPKAKEHMDAYFDRMLKLLTNQKLSSRVRFMLRDAIDLRKNKWQQRRKIEGPKKIEEVHRDAAQERQAQASRLARGTVITSAPRRGPPVDYGPRGSTVLSSPSSQQIGGVRGLPAQVRGYATQDVRREDRHQFESRVLSVPLSQRPIDDDSITLGPQGGLARGMSIRGQPLMSNVPSADIPPSVVDPRRLASGPNGYSSISRQESMPRYMQDKFSGAPYDQPSPQDRNTSFGSRDSRIADHAIDRSTTTTPTGRIHGSSSGILHAPSEEKTLSEESLREKSISAIREFYSAKDEQEVALCIRELNSPSFYPSMVSLWVTDSFERKDLERDLIARLLVNLCKSRDSLLSQTQLIQGFESVLSSLEDAVNDAPKAAEFLGHMLAKVTLENVVPLREIARLVREGGEEPGSLVKTGLASDVIGSILQFIRTEKGDSVLNEIRMSSNLRLEDFRPPHSTKSNKLDVFF